MPKARTIMRSLSLGIAFCIFTSIYSDGCLMPAANARAGKENTADPANKNLKLGRSLYNKKDYDGAIDALLQATYFARNGYNPEAFFYLGMAYKDKGDYRKAVEALRKHCEQATDKAALGHIELAECYIALKEYDEAEKHIWAAQNGADWQSHLFYRCHYVYAKFFEAQGKNDQALDKFGAALGDKPWKYYDAWINYCECFMKAKKWVEAYKNLDELLHSREPMKGMSYDRIHLDIGICLLNKGDHQGAIDNWHRCLEYNPQNREAHIQLALLFELEKHYASAIKEYREFIRMSPDSQDGKKDERARQAEMRIAMIEQKLKEPGVPMPTTESPLQEQARQHQYRQRTQQADAERRRQAQERERIIEQGETGF